MPPPRPQVPEYDAASMGEDAEGVPLWLSLDGAAFIACGMLHMHDPITGPPPPTPSSTSARTHARTGARTCAGAGAGRSGLGRRRTRCGGRSPARGGRPAPARGSADRPPHRGSAAGACGPAPKGEGGGARVSAAERHGDVAGTWRRRRRRGVRGPWPASGSWHGLVGAGAAAGGFRLSPARRPAGGHRGGGRAGYTSGAGPRAAVRWRGCTEWLFGVKGTGRDVVEGRDVVKGRDVVESTRFAVVKGRGVLSSRGRDMPYVRLVPTDAAT